MKSVHFQIVPCSSLYFFSRSTGPFQCSPSYRVLICSSLYFFSRSTGPFQCSPSYRVLICHFQSSSLFFILASSVCKSLQYLTSALTQGCERDHLFRLTCSVVLWWGGTLQTNIPGVCGECLQCLHHTGFASAHGVCAFLVYTAQTPGYSARELPKVVPVLC